MESNSLSQDFKNCNWLSDWTKEPSIRTVREPLRGLSYECTICEISLNSVNQVRNHIRGAKHLKVKGKLDPTEMAELASGNRGLDRVKGDHQSSLAVGYSPARLPGHHRTDTADWTKEPCIVSFGNEYKCTICNTYLNSGDQVRTHLRGAKHLKEVKRHLSFSGLDEPSVGNRSSMLNDNIPTAFSNRDSPFQFFEHFDGFKELLEDIKVFKPDDEIVFSVVA